MKKQSVLVTVDQERDPYRWAGDVRRAMDTVVLVSVIVLLGLTILKLLSIETSETAHIPNNSRSTSEFSSVPATSGPHYSTAAEWAIYDEPLRYEQVLRNLEEGGVAVYYQCDPACPELVKQLEEIVTPYLASGRKVLLLPNVPTWREMYNKPWHQDMGARIAVTTWKHTEKYNKIEPAKIQAFIERHEGMDHQLRE